MSWLKHLRHFIHREVKQVEHVAQRSLFYAAAESAYVTGVAAAAVSYLWTPVAGAAVGAIGGEATYYGEYYAARENKKHGQKVSTWEARHEARKMRMRAWEYAAAGVGLGVAAGALLPASGFSASVEVGALSNPSAVAALESGTLEAQGLGETAVNLTDAEFASALGHGGYLSLAPTTFGGQTPGFFGQAWNFVSGLPSLAYNNPVAALGIAGAGAGVAGQLGLFGKTGKQVAQDIQFAQGVAGELGSLGGSSGGPPIGGDAGAGGSDWAQPGSLMSQLAEFFSQIAEPLLIGGGLFILLLALFLGS